MVWKKIKKCLVIVCDDVELCVMFKSDDEMEDYDDVDLLFVCVLNGVDVLCVVFGVWVLLLCV